MSRSSSKREQFLTAVEEVAVKEGYDPMSVLIHAEHETGHFEHIIGWNNYWGIKVPKKKKWEGQVLPQTTHEIFTNNFRFARFLNRRIKDVQEVKYNEKVVMEPVDVGGGKTEKRPRRIRRWIVKLTELFIDWPREKDAVLWYMDLVQRLYKDAYDNRDNPPLFFKGLVSGTRKWATDPEYEQKLLILYESAKGKE